MAALAMPSWRPSFPSIGTEVGVGARDLFSDRYAEPGRDGARQARSLAAGMRAWVLLPWLTRARMFTMGWRQRLKPTKIWDEPCRPMYGWWIPRNLFGSEPLPQPRELSRRNSEAQGTGSPRIAAAQRYKILPRCPAYYTMPDPRLQFPIFPPAYCGRTHLADQHLLEYRVVGLVVQPLRLL
jgi:hypothetical protein